MNAVARSMPGVVHFHSFPHSFKSWDEAVAFFSMLGLLMAAATLWAIVNWIVEKKKESNQKKRACDERKALRETRTKQPPTEHGLRHESKQSDDPGKSADNDQP